MNSGAFCHGSPLEAVFTRGPLQTIVDTSTKAALDQTIARMCTDFNVSMQRSNRFFLFHQGRSVPGKALSRLSAIAATEGVRVLRVKEPLCRFVAAVREWE